MNSIRNIARLNEAELEKVIPPNASWHTDYRDTAYIHIGGLPLDLSEGDVLLIFSQYGNPTDVKLARDKDSGKSRGFGWLKYEDQRSCDLAVDNLSGASVLGRLLSVDHARYKMKDGERETVGEEEEDVTDREGEERGGKRRRRRSSESEGEEERPMIQEEVELATLLREHDEDDPMKAYLVQEKRKEVEEALKAVTISKPKQKDSTKREHRHHHRSRRGESEDEEETRRSNGHRSRRKERTSKDDGEDEDADADARSSRRRRSASIEGKRKRERRIGRDDHYKPDMNGKQHNRSHRHHDSDSEDDRRRRRSDGD